MVPGKSLEDNSIIFRADIDELTEGMRQYHETDVAHYQAKGDLTVQPKYLVALSAPTSTYPKRVSIRGYFNGSTSLSTQYCNMGFGEAGIISRTSSSGRTYVLSSTSNFIEVIDISSIPITITSSSSLTITRTSYEIVSYDGKVLRHLIRQCRGQVKPYSLTTKGSDFSVDTSLFEKCWNIATGVAPLVTDNKINPGDTFVAATKYSFSLSSFRGWINTNAIPMLEEVSFPFATEHFGVLAQEASQKVNRNQVNMIAFLRDLKNPRALIPKLKNLEKLKTLSGNYLGMQYGILPTISDLKEIAAAFQKHKPYIDKNGFKLYTASHQRNSSDSIYEFDLVQRIKIAIEDEDNGFVDLMNRVESSGFAPTLENIWDLIPYSFVLDWFVNVGDFLERVDSKMRLARLNIRFATMSQKFTKTWRIRPSANIPYDGTINLVQYSRWTTDRCPVPPLFFQNTPTVSNHWLEASALLIQRAK
jgi:hypothetical protein